MIDTDWSPEQTQAIDAIQEWVEGPGPQAFTLGGFAGTGKSTLVSYVASNWGDRTAVAALSGKAASVLRKKGVSHAQTIHSLMYDPWEDELGKLHYRRKVRLDCDRVIIDEASMVSKWIHDDLMSFGVQVLYVGDHGQLEPIGEDPKLMGCPMARLETIHRQAAGNPILRLAAAFREGRPVPYWSDKEGRLRIVPKRTFSQYVTSGAQVLCGFNKTRHEVNQRVRTHNGYKGLICEGERLICLRNNAQFDIFNGQQATVEKIGRRTGRFIDVGVRMENGLFIEVPMLCEQFGRNVIADHADIETTLWDYAYGITVHKSQGSEWSRVVVLDELSSLWKAGRWRYTAATRASEELVYCM